MIATVAALRHGGTHLIRPIVRDLGFKIVEPGKDAPLDQAQGPVVVFLRDPRNRMVATYRWWLDKPRKASSMAAGGADADGQIAWLLTEGDFLAEMLRWARIWCNWPDAMKVRFEVMQSLGVGEIARIADHLGKPVDYERAAEIWDAVWLKGRTYTGKHSNWRESFGPKSNAAWAACGGPDLLWMMGYA